MGCGASTSDKAVAVNTTQQPKEEPVFKIMFIGDSGVGKSSLLLQYTDGSFTEQWMSTIGMDFKVRKIELDGKTFTLQLWDMAGQERYRNIIASYYKGVDGIMVLYDVTNKESFNSIKQWLADIDRYTSGDVAKILVGNKCDEIDNRVIDYTTAKEFADESSIPFLEVSAKSNTNVEQAFMTLVAELKRTRLK